MSYEDKILLKLRRDYSKDEAVSFISEKLSKVEVELGKCKAELAHKEHEIHELKCELGDLNKWRADIKQYKKDYREGVKSSIKDVIVNNYKEEIASLRSKCKKLEVENERLFSRVIVLKNGHK